MLRFVNICLVLGLVALAYVIYQVKYETRGLDAEIASLNKNIDQERDAVAVLRAEWSLLNRPERIERLAKKYLGLSPAKPAQLLTVDTVSGRNFDRGWLERAISQPPPAAKPAKPKTKAALAASAPQKDTPLAAADGWSATTVTTRAEAQ
jgi:cell division protein FtsL